MLPRPNPTSELTGDERGDGRRTRVWIDGVVDSLIASRTEITVPGSKIVYRGEMAGIRPQITYLVEPVDGGARFTRSVDLDLIGALVLVTPVMAMVANFRTA